ncbi:MAG: DNA topoisomerase IV subunit B [Candidatus Nanopelagicales bacterium]
MPTTTATYSADALTVLEGLDAVRKRPGMYIGSTDGRGLMHCVWEIIDNAVDEALAGFCTNVTVTLLPDGSVEVTDNGRGIPVDVQKKSRLTGVELVMTKLHAGGKFGGGSYGAAGGLHGVGASVVNALSARLDIEVDREGRTWGMSFRRGVPGVFDGEGPDAAFTRKTGLLKRGTAPKTRTGTRIRFWPDPQIFTKDTGFDRNALWDRARQTAFLVPDLAIQVKDARSEHDQLAEVFRFKGGISEYIDYLADDEAVTGVVRLDGEGHFTEHVPVLDGKGHMATQDVERTCHVSIALRWGTGYESLIRSFVNVIATPKGGTHVTGFERALTKTVNEQLRAQRVLRASEDSVTKDDILEGLTAVVTVRLAEPQFEGQTKEVLGTPQVSGIVSRVVGKQLTEWFSKPPRGEKASAKGALDKVASAARARLAARQTRDVQRRKNALESSALPAKLADCRSGVTDRTELFIVEGDSALGTAKSARNSEFQALLPIRGKILNVQKASMADMLKNAECASILQVIGGGTGRSFDLDQVRYGKIILMTDADVDGAHIRCLLLTLIHRYMSPLLDAGRVFAAVPPLHRLEIVRPGAKNEVRYTYSDEEMKKLVADLQKKGVRVKDPIQRYKGLGEMDSRQLRETTMDPAKRQLRRVTVSDASASNDVFGLLMGNEVAPRRGFIVEGSQALDREMLDV